MDKYTKANNVIFAGQKEHHELLTLLDDSDVFLFPSHSEGFSIALAEAMAKGLPCIVTDVGANADMISDETGKIVPKNDVNAIEEAIKSIKPYEVRLRMSQKSVNKVMSDYTQNEVMIKIFQLYKKVLKK